MIVPASETTVQMITGAIAAARPIDGIEGDDRNNSFQSGAPHRYRRRIDSGSWAVAVNIKPLFTAVATATGGRNGHTSADDGSLSVDLSVPKAMGGPGKPHTTTPEHLFAAGYAACFGSALDYVASRASIEAKSASVSCSVSIGRRGGGGFGLAVRLHVVDARIPQAELEALVRIAHEKICPYSHATRGNVEVDLSVQGA